MNKAQRAPWMAVVQESVDAAEQAMDADPEKYVGHRTLCSACRYFVSYPMGEFGGGPYEWECDHGLESVQERQGDYVWEGADCWGFRPVKGFTVEDFKASKPARPKW